MKQPKKPDIITISIYAILGLAILYMAAAIGTCLGLSVGENGKTDFDAFSQNLNTVLRLKDKLEREQVDFAYERNGDILETEGE